MSNSAFSTATPLERIVDTDYHYIQPTDSDDSFSVGANSVATGSNMAVGGGITVEPTSASTLVVGFGMDVTGDYNIIGGAGGTFTGDNNLISSPGSTVTGSQNYVFGLGNTVTGSNNMLFGTGLTLTASGQIKFGYPLSLSGAPTVDLHAATKKYVDDGLALKLGSTLAATGTIDDSNTVFTFASLPTLIFVNGAAYKQTGGSLTWTWSAGPLQATLSQAVGTGGTIWGL